MRVRTYAKISWSYEENQKQHVIVYMRLPMLSLHDCYMIMIDRYLIVTLSYTWSLALLTLWDYHYSWWIIQNLKKPKETKQPTSNSTE